MLLNCASGLVLGKAFLDACRSAGTQATLVVCSSPAAAAPVYGASHYGAGKAALQYWAATVATEVDSRVLCVVPYAVDTPMVRATIAQPPGATPISDHLRAAAERGELATPEATAAQIWSLVLDDTTSRDRRAGRRGPRRTEEHDMTAITTTDLVLAERRGAVLVLTLNRPERLNAWTDALEDRYYEHLDAAENDPEVRAIVVTGAGPRLLRRRRHERPRARRHDATAPRPRCATVRGRGLSR